MNPAARKEETVAVVDERALVEAMYEKLLPRMKVELSLWLQDALELQAKNMLSGVMQQLKEDYDMLFGETLKESLRQAILALGRAAGPAWPFRRRRIDGTPSIRIVTRTGDDGSTGLGDGSRVTKDCLRVQALGDVDELNSVLGVLLAESLPADVSRLAGGAA
jgi:hypothetical protein